MHNDIKASGGSVTLAARRLAIPAIGAGLLGGLALGVVMVLVMGAAGMGYATPFNLGLPAFVYTITPPLTMLPTLMSAMGIQLPASAMSQLMPGIQSGHLSPAIMQQLGTMLSGMHVPPATVQKMGQLMSGTASNTTMADLMKQMPRSGQHTVMAAMAVSASRVVVGVILHFAYAGFLGLVFAALIVGAAWLGVPGLRSSAGILTASTAGGALLYVIMRWGLLPPTNPLMALVPQLAFFLSHLLFGLIVGVVLAWAVRRYRVLELLPAPGWHR